MTAPNHALSGALLGLLTGEPLMVVGAFLSHFVLDALPHYDPPGDELTRLRSKRFARELIVQMILCGLLVTTLALTRPEHWLLACACAFAATAPDLLWIPKFRLTRREGRLPARPNIFWRFHTAIQWRTAPQLWWVEASVFVGLSAWLASRL